MYAARRGGITAACTISLGGDEQDEAATAATTARRIGLEHDLLRAEADALAHLPSIIACHGEPFADSSAMPTLLVSRLARQRATVALSGDGGDELFLGYDSYRAWLDWLDMPLWKRTARATARLVAPGRFPSRRDWPANWLRHQEVMAGRVRRGLWRPELRPIDMPPWAVADAAGGLSDPLRIAQSADVHCYLPGDILAKVDAASMACSLEVRPPLLDLRVAEFAARLPASALISNGPGGHVGKTLLRDLLAREDPGFPHAAPKRGFAVPLAAWVAEPGRQLRDRIHTGKTPLLELFLPNALAASLTENGAGGTWQLLVLEAWLLAFRPGLR
jgi:asparagine synthase (glutamine-hydrolysing)